MSISLMYIIYVFLFLGSSVTYTLCNSPIVLTHNASKLFRNRRRGYFIGALFCVCCRKKVVQHSLYVAFKIRLYERCLGHYRRSGTRKSCNRRRFFCSVLTGQSYIWQRVNQCEHCRLHSACSTIVSPGNVYNMYISVRWAISEWA